MTKLFILLFAATLAVTGWAQNEPDNLVLVPGGRFRNSKSNYGKKVLRPVPYADVSITIADFYIGKYEVTQKEWSDVMGSNPAKFKGDNLPVESVNWYDCVEYCNRRSLKEGLQPVYRIDKEHKDPNNGNDIDDIKWTVTLDEHANGYRLPTEAEWEYAASGGQLSRNYPFPGSNAVDAVAWYYRNSGDAIIDGYWNWPVIQKNHNQTKPVGLKPANELGLHDLGGNVREWCWNWFGAAASVGTGPEASKEGRVWNGGGWLGGDFCCAIAWRASYEASGRGPDQGLRVCRSK
jgi:formylglycine-generating enzyme